jgi:metal-responsive CopG/Arc/MetJ family transcriptional regulator
MELKQDSDLNNRDDEEFGVLD